jgi:hypothetical protein
VPTSTLCPPPNRDNSVREHCLDRVPSNAIPLNREEFCGLLVSRRSLIRIDDWGACVYGLFEPATGCWFVIDMTELAESSGDE